MKLYDTLSRSKLAVPHNGPLKFYSCGPTVYSTPQIGNMLAYIRWDILKRALLEQQHEVVHVMNITDVGHLTSDADEGEDKLEKGARREGTTAWEVAERYTAEFVGLMNQLNIIPPTIMPKATEHIQEQIDLIKAIESKGHTYSIEGDGLYFDVTTFSDYTKLSHQPLDHVVSRIGQNSAKRHPADFALWKYSPEGEKRDMEWDSPWGVGFPGWHIECSAMAMKYLGSTLDIHAGGIDHIPVHHTNEIAQSESATGAVFSRIWVHSNFLKVNGQKIAKSLGNGYLIRDIIDRGFDELDFRMFTAQAHYRSEINFSWDSLLAARARRYAWISAACLRWQFPVDKEQTIDLQPIRDAIDDDLNTPLALSQIDAVMNDAASAQLLPSNFNELLKYIDALLGLMITESSPDINRQAKEMLAERSIARQNKDWAASDELRKRLEQDYNVSIKDSSNGQIWEHIAPDTK